jgi:hypothetical protein
MEMNNPLQAPISLALGTHWTVGSVSPRAHLDVLAKRKISCPCRESSRDSCVVQNVSS